MKSATATPRLDNSLTHIPNNEIGSQLPSEPESCLLAATTETLRPNTSGAQPTSVKTSGGKTEALVAIHQQLQPGARMSISSIAGMGGIGKTELALQYAHQQLKAKDYPGGICWLNARGDLGTQIVSFARSRLQLTIPEDLELAEQVRRCWRDWQQDETLIVLDDVQPTPTSNRFCPRSKLSFGSCSLRGSTRNLRSQTMNLRF